MLMLLSIHVTSVLVLVRFNYFTLTMYGLLLELHAVTLVTALVHTYLWWWWSSRIGHTSRGWGVAGGLLWWVASWPRWVASSRRIGHLQQRAGRQVLLCMLTATTVKELLHYTMNLNLLLFRPRNFKHTVGYTRAGSLDRMHVHKVFLTNHWWLAASQSIYDLSIL